MINGSLAIEDRHETLLQILRERGSIDLNEATAQLGVHQMTVRRDLDYLEQQGLARRVRGGAVATGHDDFSGRMSRDIASKRKIAKKLFPLVPSNSAICMDASTTVHQLAQLIRKSAGLSIVTNGMATFQELQHRPGVAAYLTGGESAETNFSLVGPVAVRAVELFQVARTFLSATSLAADGTSEPTMPEAEVKVAMASAAAHVVLAVDSTKFGQRSLSRSLALSSIDLLVTELNPRDPRLDPFRDQVELL
jgi:DeoR/GlpR family transcriptional regulator of sugar metabolism